MQNTNSTANPGPLGLTGFGLTTVLLNLHNAGFFPMDAMILAMGIFMGGMAQVIVGVMEWKKNNIFGTIAFTSYGFFWISLVALILLPKMGIAEAASPVSMGFYLLIWGVFSFGLFIATLKIGRHLVILFGLLVILFALLAIGDFTGNHGIKVLAGYEGILCGSTAIYIALAEVINAVYGKKVLPL